MKRIRNLLIFVLAACLLLAACGEETPAPVYTDPPEDTDAMGDLGQLVILFTGDLENIFARDDIQGRLGYAALKAYREQLEDEGETVVLVDGGNAIMNQRAGMIQEGKKLADLIADVGYDIRVPGAGELTYGLDGFKTLAKRMEDCTYISCDLTDDSGEAVYAAYEIVKCGEVSVGFVGITAPATAEITDSAKNFYAAVQDAIDSANDAGAEYVIAVGNLGTDPENSPWTSAEVIANTTGLSAFLDCGYGAVLEGSTVRDLDNYEVPLCAPGSEFSYVGQVTLDLNNGKAEITLLTELEKENRSIASQATELQEKLEEQDAATAPTEELTEPPETADTTETTE